MTVVTPNAALSSATRTNPRSATSARARSRRRGASSGAPPVIAVVAASVIGEFCAAFASLCNTKPGCLRNESRVCVAACTSTPASRFARRPSPTAASSSTSTTPTRRCRAERAIDERVLDPRPATAHMRQDPLTGEWISIAAARQNRVFLPPADLDPLAPQTAGQPVGDPERLRRRRVREPLAVVRPAARRSGCLERRRPRRAPPRRPRAHRSRRSAAARSSASAPSTRARSAR